jgi:hypothetical protein
MKIDLPTLRYESACFAGGTLIHTKEGLKPIETIQVGDWVLSKHESGEGERAYKRVTQTFKHEDREVINARCCVVGADKVNHTCYLVVTPEHPIWVQGKGWKPAGKLKTTLPGTVLEVVEGSFSYPGSSVRLFKTEDPEVAWYPRHDNAAMLQAIGHRIHVPTAKLIEQDVFIDNESVRRSGRVKPEDLYRSTVYNLEVEDFHTYYVGEAGVWVHNKNIQVSSAVAHGYAPTVAETSNAFLSRSELNNYLKKLADQGSNGATR